MGSSITSVRLLKDRVIVEYHLRKPVGELDKDDRFEVLYEKIDSLPRKRLVPRYVRDGSAFWPSDDICIPRLNKRIFFTFSSTLEGNRVNDEIHGPFLIE